MLFLSHLYVLVDGNILVQHGSFSICDWMVRRRKMWTMKVDPEPKTHQINSDIQVKVFIVEKKTVVFFIIILLWMVDGLNFQTSKALYTVIHTFLHTLTQCKK